MVLQAFRVLPFPKVLLNVVRVRIVRQIVVRQALLDGGELHSPFFLQAVCGLLQSGNLQLEIFLQDFSNASSRSCERVAFRRCAPTSGERLGMAVGPSRWSLHLILCPPSHPTVWGEMLMSAKNVMRRRLPSLP